LSLPRGRGLGKQSVEGERCRFAATWLADIRRITTSVNTSRLFDWVISGAFDALWIESSFRISRIKVSMFRRQTPFEDTFGIIRPFIVNRDEISYLPGDDC